MSVDTKLFAIHLGLAFKESQTSPRRKCYEEPGIITGRFHCVNCPLCHRNRRKRIFSITTGCMVSIQCAPIRCEFVFGVFYFTFPKKFNLMRGNSILRCRNPARPSNRKCGIPSFCIGQGCFVISILPSTVNL